MNKKPEFLYHGSKYLLDVITPMQAHGESEVESQNAIYAAETKDEVIPFALPFLPYFDGSVAKLSFRSDGINSFLDCGSIDPEGIGYIYKLPSDTFEKVDEWEWNSRVAVKPLEIIPIKVSDYLNTITFSDKAKEIQKNFFGYNVFDERYA